MQQTRTRGLRELIAQGAVMMPGVPNAAMARQVERAGFEAVYISGAGMANATAGVPDIGLLTSTEVAQLAGYVANAVTIPAIVDADTGFGGAENVARTIRQLEQAGLAGCHIEDQEFPKRCGHLAGKEVVDVDEMVGKIKAAVGARRDEDFLTHCAHRCACRRGFRQHSRACAELCRSRCGRDFSGSFAKQRGVQSLRPRNESAAPREHDGVWQESPTLISRVIRFRIQNGNFSDECVSRFDESKRQILARSEKAGNTIGLARQNADA